MMNPLTALKIRRFIGEFVQDKEHAEIAIEGLALIGEPAIPALLNAIETGDHSLKAHSMRALGEMGSSAVSAVPALLKEANDKESEERYNAIEALGKIGSPLALDTLSAALKEGNSRIITKAAAHALQNMGACASNHLLPIALSEEYAAGEAGKLAAESLRDARDSSLAPKLIGAMESHNPHVRANAAKALGGMDFPTVPLALAVVLKDESPIVRAEAAAAFGELRVPPPEIAPLITALNDPVAKVRKNAAWALGELGDSRADSPLIGALKDEDAEVVLACCDALAKLVSSKAVPHLSKLLNGANTKFRDDAAYALKEIGEPAAKTFVAALKDGNEELRAISAEALGKIGCHYGLSALVNSLYDDSPKVRAAAAEALGKINSVNSFGKKANSAIPRLIDLLLDGDEDVVVHSAHTLSGLVPENVQQLHSLRKAMIIMSKTRDWNGEKKGEMHFFAQIYRRWAGRLAGTSAQEHKGMQAPPARFRKLPGKPGMNSAAGARKLAIGGAKR
ncbi:HEAT repeat domain-containing protein [Candidatus Micrarchaeota archaeon]|nr:HEAT repeat domain-containing protein [Candidatus Micrarchaeota archaeon]